MQIAQRHEAGQITYHRTDGAKVAPEAQETARALPPAEMLRWGQEIRQRCSTNAADSDRATADLLLQDFIATSEPAYPSAVACLLDDLVFATLWQASVRWQRVRMTDLELAMLRRLRRELELEPSAPEPTSVYQKVV